MPYKIFLKIDLKLKWRIEIFYLSYLFFSLSENVTLCENFHYFIRVFLFLKSDWFLAFFFFQGILPWKQHSLASVSSLSSENPSFTVSSVETREPGLFLQEVSQCLGIQQLFPEVNNHVRCLWMDCMAKCPVTIFMEEWFKKTKQNWRKGKFQESAQCHLGFLSSWKKRVLQIWATRL